MQAELHPSRTTSCGTHKRRHRRAGFCAGPRPDGPRVRAPLDVPALARMALMSPAHFSRRSRVDRVQHPGHVRGDRADCAGIGPARRLAVEATVGV